MFKRLAILYPIFLTSAVFLMVNVVMAQVIPPKARGTQSGGPTIDQAQKGDVMGPKARVAVSRFEDKSAKGRSTGKIGDGMAEMLSNALFTTNRFIVLERGAVGDILKEQDFGASGRVKQETAAKIGEIEGADLLIQGTITEFEPGASGAEGRGSGRGPKRLPGPFGRGFGDIGVGITRSHVAMIVKVIDAKTSRILASEQVEGKATDISGMASMGGGGLSSFFSGYSNTPMEKAIRVAIEESVRLIVAKTPAEYYRVGTTPQPPTTAPARTVTPTPASTQPPSPTPAPSKTQGTEPQIVYVNWPKVSFREGPGTDYKILAEITKGTGLAVIGEKGPWLKVRLEDGREGWIGKATTSANP
ncbi:MAG: SH3 domain-containing protein [Deltaproteobacteria bacterium]|nr:SH3 domain-containing protein [Deltaproteobacteria bacterium]